MLTKIKQIHIALQNKTSLPIGSGHWVSHPLLMLSLCANTTYNPNRKPINASITQLKAMDDIGVVMTAFGDVVTVILVINPHTVVKKLHPNPVLRGPHGPEVLKGLL